ncbi:MAG TPA: hypothetical protein VEC99_07060, partial [Clostridia bacterium]|nr:hypothetical protein [Clostridia bacterium]
MSTCLDYAVHNWENTSTKKGKPEVCPCYNYIDYTNCKLGHIYRLDIPSNSLAYSVDIKMQFVKSLADSPFPNGYHGGVELRPGGLAFLQPATLTVTFPQGVPSDYTPLAWDSGGWNPHMCIARTYSNRVVIPVMHFSGFGGAGAGAGEAGKQQSQNPACPKYAGEEAVAAAIKASAAQYQGATFDPADLIPAFKQWFDTSVWPGLKTAESDYLSLDYAIREFQTWHRAFQLVGLPELAQEYSHLPPDSGTAEQRILLSLKHMIETKVPNSMARGYANAIVQTHIRAVSEHDAWVAHEMLQYARSAELLG